MFGLVSFSSPKYIYIHSIILELYSSLDLLYTAKSTFNEEDSLESTHNSNIIYFSDTYTSRFGFSYILKSIHGSSKHIGIRTSTHTLVPIRSTSSYSYSWIYSVFLEIPPVTHFFCFPEIKATETQL